ncbi:MAG: hypothetical protein Nkreftii_002597 [Candidatus Nitrospira kreftii]|uniref:Uncharacterized protein n=1 Tax=Candidatus Nitrospira kreftii TaxID=2652173 RepID=A0A7S8FFE9_9BACT|nr:MAG: hypothetical protein Nkreftii_002597 [Candidatus Nitrospira kreftii]
MTKHDTRTDALLDDLLKGCASPEEILGEHGLLKGLTKRLVERALAAELTTYLGMRLMPACRRNQTMLGMAVVRRRSRPSKARSTWRCRAIGRARVNRPWSRNGIGGLRGLMIRCWLSMPMGPLHGK